MIDFVEYVVGELSSKRLAKADALDLIRQLQTSASGAASEVAIDSLLHRNTSEFAQQSYEAVFSGEEPFLRDHVVKGHRILPGVAYLEMVRQAVLAALPEAADAVLEIRNVVWAQPIIVDERKAITVALIPAESHDRDGAIDYEIYSVVLDGSGATNEQIHSQGQVLLTPNTESAPRHDFATLRGRMTRGRIDAEQLYTVFDGMGMEYGPAQRAVRRLHQGVDEVLAHLVLPDIWAETDAAYVLHPSIMDAALQSALGFIDDIDTGSPQPLLPFALDNLRIFSGCTDEMVAWLRLSPDQAASRRVTRIDIDLCDAEGRVCVQWRGFSSRELGAASAASAESAGRGVIYAAPEWQDRTANATDEASPRQTVEHNVLLCGGLGELTGALDGVHVHTVSDDVSLDLATRYGDTALACFSWLRQRFETRLTDPVLLQLAVPDDAFGQLLLGLAGMLRSAALENPLLTVQIVMVAPDAAADDVLTCLQSAWTFPRDTVQRFGRDGSHQALVWHELDATRSDASAVDAIVDQAPLAFRDAGVYLITGGLGGLGSLFARDIVARCADAKVVLTGRSAPDEAIQRRLESLALPDGSIEYRQLDLADLDAVRACIADIVEAHGRINGILHCAGCLQDAFILKKTAETFREVLEPKVAGTRHLDEASRELELDFLALFSGGASVTGNVGQTDYAAANGFMDRYAAHRNALVGTGERHGVTRAINWPLWQEGGMGVAAETLEHVRQVTGILPMSTVSGLQAFQRILTLPHDQIQVVEGEVAKLRRVLFATAPSPGVAVSAVATSSSADAPGEDALRESARAFISQKLSGLLKLPADQIETDAPFEKYGINSIMMMNLTNVLEETFGSLPKTLFFEYQTLNELTEYFLISHADALARLLDRPDPAKALPKQPVAAVQQTSVAVADLVPVAAPVVSRAARRRQRFAGNAQSVREASRRDEPVAIVGLSGRYPGARDLDAYWRNLRDGIDSIEEVPADRWDWRDYFSEDRTQSGHHYSKWGGFIEGVDEFDALFFNIPPVDAERIDPQERIFLQHAWMAVEDAGYTRTSLQIPHGADQPGQVGVYVGVMYGEYQMFGAEASLLGDRGVTPSSYASIANRVSYFMNLHGPSLALDTMCSSSLTAIHLACQDLREGRTDLAIAGGVNVTIHPNKYLLLSSGQFIATDGRCQSFGEGGDGYIPAEGVGAVILKRLSEAERDGNHVYGVIRGSALNHGGKTNGYSVPNPQAQAGVISMALQSCGVDARQIGYLEAHGTGTKLGDPIEIAALTMAFRKHTPDKGFCLIGSAKSNIGHAESAAGIAGLTKVLLQMKHGMVAPSLHAAVLNPHIDFANTPFEVNRVLRPWERMEIDGRRIPRMAGLSSFGAGGSNAHLIIEEYQPKTDANAAMRPSHRTGSQAVVLSARSSEQLVQKVRDLLAFLRPADAGVDAADVDRNDVDLTDLVYTLQIGREAMEERLALVVASIGELADGLQAWLEDRADASTCYRGRANSGGGALALFNTDTDLQATIDRWFATNRLGRVADLWVQGVVIDWRKAYEGASRPRLISLPTYAFARDRCWVDRVRPSGRATATSLHPLLHANVSDLHGQAYRSTFNGQEFFLDDHRVRLGEGATQRLVPGVAYLEMMRAAAVLAVPEWADGVSLELHDITWLRPLAVPSPTTVTVTLAPDERGDLAVAITTAVADDDVQHGTGRVREIAGITPARLDLERIRERLGHGDLTSEDVYSRYTRMGIEYGRSFRCIERVQLGAEEVLAQLNLSSDLAHSTDEFWLHPALMDGALQSAIGLLVAAGRDVDQVPLPFALRSARVLAPCTPTMWAWVRYAEQRGAEASVVELDIDVCNADGDVCVELRGLASRPARREEATSAELLMAVNTWEAVMRPSPLPTPTEGWRSEVLICDLPHVDANAFAKAEGLAADACQASNSAPGSDLAEQYRHHAGNLLELLRDGNGAQNGARRWLQVVLPSEDPQRVLTGLDGMLRTAAMENPAIRAQIVLVPSATSTETLARHLREAGAIRHEPVIAFENGAMRVRRWQVLPQDSVSTDTSAFRNDGIYLITGGMGGLGQVFAGYILSLTSHAQVVLTGRSALDGERQQQFDALSAGSGRLHYRELDLTDEQHVRTTVNALVQTFGGLHGILHSAGTSRDGLLPTRTKALLDEVLAPKVSGTQWLDQATGHLDLDFFALFSSVSGALGNVGQADYAAANGFLDQFAAHRERQVIAGLRRGKTLSINWPLWAEGGMGLEASAIDLLWRTAGVRPLSTSAGLMAFERSLLRVSQPQVLVLSGDAQRLQRLLEIRPKVEAPAATAVARPAAVADARTVNAKPADEAGATSREEQAEAYLREHFSRVLKVPAHRIDPRASLEHYGIDSVVAMTLTAELEKHFGELPKTLLFEHQTIERLARHLLATFPQRMRELSGAGERADTARPQTSTSRSTSTPATVVRSKAVAAPNRFRLGSSPRAERRVAIVGAAGRYPQAESLDLFWDNLRAGRDCITEVPTDRWDHGLYFDPARNQPGKTYSKWGGFLDNIDKFDALFFNVSPREAELIDPQERLFLETAWETIEDAGYSKDRLAGQRIGVYVGVMWGQYELYAGDAAAGIPTSSHASIANRVSYFFDFHGPSLALDTMCSSSLSAIHLAAEDIRRGTVDAAIAGGVNLTLHPQKYLNLSQGNFVSSDGRCRSFGDGGDGYVPGEGAGAILLKSLDDALRDGDQVYAIVEASALNHGGKTHGYTVPNPVAQTALILEVLKTADIDPRSVGYIETHGTGTSLGDPIELAGLRQAFAEYTDEKSFCAIGSVKSNIGHLEAAAGIAALTKALLQIRHGELVPSLHAEITNPHIDFASSPFHVQTRLAPWPRRDGQPRRAAVSAFGAGGANAHLILAEYLPQGTGSEQVIDLPVSGPELFVLSGRDEAALVRYATRMADFLGRPDGASLRDIAHTSRVGRTALPVRLAVLATSRAELRDKLSRWASSQPTIVGTPRATNVDDCYVGRVVDAGSGGLIPGETGQAFLSELLNREDWRALARLWIAGAEVDWTQHASDVPAKRVSLPTYPFARERYWVGGGRKPVLHSPAMAATIPPAISTSIPVQAQAMAKTLLYRPEWVEQAVSSTLSSVHGPILVLGATPDWREALSERLGQASMGSVSMVGVSFGTAFEVLAPDHIVVDPGCDDDADKLVATLQANGLMPRIVLHRQVASFAATDDASTPESTLDRNAHLLASLAKALMAHRHTGETRFLSLVSGPSAVNRALGAALGGFYASLHRENPTYRTKVVEIIPTATSVSIDDVEIAVAELTDTVWGSQVYRVLARPDHAQTTRLQRRWALQSPPPRAAGRQAALKQHGVYLISGGMGALGRLLAEFLARQYQARLVLMGRSPLGEGIERQLEALRALGGDAVYVQAEVADSAQTEAAVQQARQQFGQLDGVLHVAGIHRDAFLLKKTREDRVAVFAPKILGALHLDHATREDALDLFVTFSSVAGALGNAGQTDYAYANHFLDAFAHERADQVAKGSRQGRTLSIDWPLWASEGMRPNDEVVASSERAGLAPLPAEAGLEALENLLAMSDAQGMVLHGDPGRIAIALRAMDDSAAPDIGRGIASCATSSISTDLARLTQDYLRERIGEEIRLDPSRIDDNERFDAYGIDSMMVGRLNERLMADLGDLPKTLFYEYSTVAELAEYLVREASAPLSVLLNTSSPGVAGDVAGPSAPVRMEAAPVEIASPVSAIADAAQAGEGRQPVADEPIAIIGMHGYYPQSSDLDALWEHLRQGDDLIGLVPSDRWDAEAFHDPDPDHASQGKIYCKWGAFLEDHDKFDANFFRIGDAEAVSIDPQERLFLQSVWSAFEDASITREDLRKRFPRGKSAHVGVFVGVTTNAYHLLGAEHWQDPDSASPSSLPWSIANRVSYVFDFQGSSLPVDTACSSSLVAIHLASESLRRGECQVAVAGGVNLYLHPAKYHGFCQRRMLAQHGKCRSYGDGDDGFIPGEGVGSLILKPLSQAEKDGDRIHGLILASGQNHSGRSNGYSAPNPNSQALLIGDVLRRADISPASIGYVEGHGTGTQLGDSLEVRAMTQAFGSTPLQSCVLGSIKANVGHTESAAGILGVTKVLLQMRHRQFVPSIHSEPVNQNIEFDRTPFRLLNRLESWDVAPDQRRRALVNAFGAGGVNACLVLEEYVPHLASSSSRAPTQELFVLSARSEDRLRDYASAWIEYLQRDGMVHDLPAIARALRTGREAMPERLALVVSDTAELVSRLQTWLKCDVSDVYRGSSGANRASNGLLRQDERMLMALVQAQDLHGIAQAWVAGTDLPWQQLPSVADRPPQGTLPTYPFAKTRYWPSNLASRAAVADATPVAALQLHPLVSHNASNLWETRYTSVLSRDAFYAKDHRVNDERILPGSAWLEIARAAGTLASMSDVWRIRDVVFVRPLMFADPIQVAVTTLQVIGEDVVYTIASHDPVQGTVVHSEGVLDCGAAHASQESGLRVPVASLLEKSTGRIEKDTCYARFRQSGLDYGPTFQTIQTLHLGDGFVLARLSLSPSLLGEADDFGLHPSLIDGALQTISGFAGAEETSGPFLPFAIDEVTIHGSAPRDCYVYVVEGARPKPGNDELRKFDIEIVTEEGTSVVSLKGLTVRAFKSQPSIANTHSSVSFS
jgi:polyketide synthase PksL